MGRKVLVINSEFPPIGGAGVQRVLKFVKYLPEKGWEPSVVCGARSAYNARNDKSLLEELPKYIEVVRVNFNVLEDYIKIGSVKGGAILFPFRVFLSKERIREGLRWRLNNLLYKYHPEPLLSWVYLATQQAARLYKRKRFDVVLTSGPPHITHVVGLIMKWFYRVKWVVDFRDPWTDSIVSLDRASLISLDRSIYGNKLDKFWERLVLRKSDKIVTVSEGLAEFLSKKISGLENGKIHVIFNGYDTQDIPCDFLEPKRIYNRNVLHIHFNGLIGNLYNKLDLFLEGLAQLKTEIPDLDQNLVCTFTGLEASLMNMVRERGLSNIIIDVGALSHRESLRVSACCDVLLLILNNFDNTARGTMTGKVYEYVALGKDILAIIPFGGDLHKFLMNYGKSHIVNSDDIGGIAKALQLLIKKKRNKEIGAFDPPGWIRQYTRQNQTKQLANILESLTLSISSS